MLPRFLVALLGLSGLASAGVLTDDLAPASDSHRLASPSHVDGRTLVRPEESLAPTEPDTLSVRDVATSLEQAFINATEVDTYSSWIRPPGTAAQGDWTWLTETPLVDAEDGVRALSSGPDFLGFLKSLRNPEEGALNRLLENDALRSLRDG